jgi:hypothetical protein
MKKSSTAAVRGDSELPAERRERKSLHQVVRNAIELRSI